MYLNKYLCVNKLLYVICMLLSLKFNLHRRTDVSAQSASRARRGEAGARAHRLQRGREPARPDVPLDVQQLGGQRGRAVSAGVADRHPELALVHADDGARLRLVAVLGVQQGRRPAPALRLPHHCCRQVVFYTSLPQIGILHNLLKKLTLVYNFIKKHKIFFFHGLPTFVLVPLSDIKIS